MKNTRWTLSAAALCVMALSAYGCSSDPATGDDDADDDTTSSSSSGGKASSSSGGKSSSSSGGKSSSSSSSGGSSGSSTSSGGSSGSTSSSSGGSSSSSGDAGASSSGGGDGGSGACTTIVAANWANAEVCGPQQNQPCASLVEADFTPAVGVNTTNRVGFGFAAPPTTVLGTEYDLSDADNANQFGYAFAGVNVIDKEFIIESGKAKVTAYTNDANSNNITATLTNVKFVEATYAGNVATPVPNGLCLILPTAAIAVVNGP